MIIFFCYISALKNFENVKKGSLGTIEDPIFAFRAAAPVLACNASYFDKKVINWDPVAMKVKKN